MNAKLRSTEAPMDFQFTSRPNTRPSWVTDPSGLAESSTPRKRTHTDSQAPKPHFPHTLHEPSFGKNQNVPFIFQSPPPQSQEEHPWAPPSSFSVSRTFPQPISQELKDIDMAELNPTGPELNSETRAVATGGMSRVFKSRQKSREKARRLHKTLENESDAESESDESDSHISRRPVKQTTSNHYTLNVPSPLPPQSDLPYILLGYLQFFFNLSLVLVFLYLVLQFILTVQRDVEHRISEYSMDIVQEIAKCSSQYRNNHCESNPMPALTQQCASWETCMLRDPAVVGRARVGAELIAEVVNGFVEPISWKTLVFALTSLSFLTVFINSLLSLYRARHQPSVVTAAPPHAYSIPSFPPQHFGGYLSPAPMPGWDGARGGEHEKEASFTPSRKQRRLEGGESLRL